MDSVAETGVNELLLLTKARGGNVQSFCALVRLHEERAIHIACSFVGNVEDARDISQEAFVKAYDHLHKFKGKSLFFTWFCRILINQCKDFLRKRKTHAGTFSMDAPVENSERREFAAKDPDPLTRVLNRELEQTIHAAMDQLPFKQRCVFTLRYLEGLSLEEIAETSGLSVGGVKANLWQAGQKMKKNLAGYLKKGGNEL